MKSADQQNPDPCDRVVPIEQEPRHHLVLENEFLRGFAVEIAPHDRTLCHRHSHDYLVYIAGIADVVSAKPNEQPKTILYKDGECELGSAGMVHVVENLKDTAFRNIVIEMLPRFGELRRGPDPRREFVPGPSVKVEEGLPGMQEAMSIVRPLFEDEKIAVFRLTVLSSCVANISGPAVIASPEGREVHWQQLGSDPVTLNSFRKLVWVPVRAKGKLYGDHARVVVFQPGERDEHILTVRSQDEPLKGRRAFAFGPE